MRNDLEDQRRERLRRVASELGLKFISERRTPDLRRSLYLFSLGTMHCNEIRNMLEGRINSTKLAIFDYHYRKTKVYYSNYNRTTGERLLFSRERRERTEEHAQSVIYFRSKDLNLPRFEMRPESLKHKVLSRFGHEDIDFESCSRFSKRYLLLSGNESSVRSLFDSKILSFFETRPGMSVEGDGNQLIVYRAKKRIKLREVRQFINDGINIYNLLRERCALHLPEDVKAH